MRENPESGCDGGGGGVEDPVPPGRLRWLRFRMLALLWCLVTPGAIYLIWRDQAWLRAGGILDGVRSVRLEQWVGMLLIALHVWFIQGAARGKLSTRGEN